MRNDASRFLRIVGEARVKTVAVGLVRSKCNPKSSRQRPKECIITRHKNNHRPLKSIRCGWPVCNDVPLVLGRRTHNLEIPIDLSTHHPFLSEPKDVRQFFDSDYTSSKPRLTRAVKILLLSIRQASGQWRKSRRNSLATVHSSVRFEEFERELRVENRDFTVQEPAIFEIVFLRDARGRLLHLFYAIKDYTQRR